MVLLSVQHLLYNLFFILFSSHQGPLQLVVDELSSHLRSSSLPGLSHLQHLSWSWHLWCHGLSVLYLCYTFAGIQSENEKDA